MPAPTRAPLSQPQTTGQMLLFRWDLTNKWTVFALVVFACLAGNSVYALEWLSRQPTHSGLQRKTPMLSEAILTAPYARELFVLGLMGTVFLSHRCQDHAATVVSWLWVISFINLQNDHIHRTYAAAAAGVTLIVILSSEAVPWWLKSVSALVALSFVVVYFAVESDRSHWFVLEYVCIALLMVGMMLRIRSGCKSSTSNPDLLCTNCGEAPAPVDQAP